MAPPSKSPSLLDPAFIAPALVAFVIGMVVGTLIVNVWAGVAIGAVLAFSAVLRRFAAARMQAGIDEHVRRDERR
ncbi:MAG: hypothetical protein WC558_12280 [Patulibacter sp.]